VPLQPMADLQTSRSPPEALGNLFANLDATGHG
jgi:hypothetical protein